MCSSLSDATSWASRRNRATRSLSCANATGNTLMATSRFNRVSRARNTSPMPPAPMGTRISYGPMREPEDRLKPGLCRTTRISPWRKCSDELDGLDAIDEHYSATAPCGFADGPHDAYVPDSSPHETPQSGLEGSTSVAALGDTTAALLFTPRGKSTTACSGFNQNERLELATLSMCVRK